jgi:hypothetical protein
VGAAAGHTPVYAGRRAPAPPAPLACRGHARLTGTVIGRSDGQLLGMQSPVCTETIRRPWWSTGARWNHPRLPGTPTVRTLGPPWLESPPPERRSTPDRPGPVLHYGAPPSDGVRRGLQGSDVVGFPDLRHTPVCAERRLVHLRFSGTGRRFSSVGDRSVGRCSGRYVVWLRVAGGCGPFRCRRAAPTLVSWAKYPRLHGEEVAPTGTTAGKPEPSPSARGRDLPTWKFSGDGCRFSSVGDRL